MQAGLRAVEVEANLRSTVLARFGGAARVENFRPLAGGHAGLTYGFDLCVGGALPRQQAVIKLGPPGVRRARSADVFRQAALLRALHQNGVRVPRLLWADAHETDLGAPYIVMERVQGEAVFPLLAPDEHVPPGTAHELWSGAIAALVSLERFPALDVLGDWQPVVTLEAEFAAWEATLRKAPESAWVNAGLQAREALARAMPAVQRTVLVHGDFQPSNLLFDGGSLRAVIDWDLAHLGASGLDLGWLLMFADPEYWGPHWRPWSPFSLMEILDIYRRAGGLLATEPGWFHAYAGYRFGAIACLNVHLHRTGRRADPTWERFALDIPRLFDRARSLACRL